MTTNEDILIEATRRIVEKFRPDKVILFGSHARGTADERSDMDLLVICEIPQGLRRHEFALAIDRSLIGFDPPLACDIVIFTPEEFELERQIPGSVARPAWLEGRVLYDRAA